MKQCECGNWFQPLTDEHVYCETCCYEKMGESIEETPICNPGRSSCGAPLAKDGEEQRDIDQAWLYR